MSDKKGIFPTQDSKFNEYLNGVVPLLTTDATRLGVSAARVTELGTRKSAWDTIYPLASNDSTSTKVNVAEKNTQRDGFIAFLRLIYKDIPQSVLTENDRTVLHLYERDPHTARTRILDRPVMSLTPQGGGTVQVKARGLEDGNRASMHPMADVLELAYLIIDPLNDPDGQRAPHTPEDCPSTKMFSKASFVLALGTSAPGKRLYLFARWGNTSNPDLSGPWCNLLTQMLT